MFPTYWGIDDIFIRIFLAIISFIYNLIPLMYGLFYDIANARIFSDQVYDDFANRLYTVIGIIALFLLAYTFLQGIINPEEGKKNGLDIVKRLVISLVLVTLVPTIFSTLTQIQNAVLMQNLIPNLFVGETTDVQVNEYISYEDTNGNVYYFPDGCRDFIPPADTSAEDYLSVYLGADGVCNPTTDINAAENFTGNEDVALGLRHQVAGAELAYSILEPFLKPYNSNYDLAYDYDDSAFKELNATYRDIKNIVILTGDFSLISIFSDPIEVGYVEFDWIMSLAAGIFILYTLLIYCIDLGIRAVKLTFYQLIAPVPIFLSIYPKNADLLSKWLKTTLTCFFEVFTRVFIMTIIVYLVGQFNTEAIQHFGLLGTAIIIMGIFAFAKQLPKIIEDITGISSSGAGFGLKDRLKEGGALGAWDLFRKTGLNAAVSGAAGLKQGVRNFNRTEGGLFKKTGSFLAGSSSASNRSFWKNVGSKNIKDLGSGYSEGIRGASTAKTVRDRNMSRYKVANPTSSAAGAWFKGKFSDAKDDFNTWAGKAGDLEALEKEASINSSFVEKKDATAKAAQMVSKHTAIQGSKNFVSMLDTAAIEAANKNGVSFNDLKSYSTYSLDDIKNQVDRYEKDGFVPGVTADLHGNKFNDLNEYRNYQEKLKNDYFWLDKGINDTFLFAMADHGYAGYTNVLKYAGEDRLETAIGGTGHAAANIIEGNVKEMNDMVKTNKSQFVKNVGYNLEKKYNEKDTDYDKRIETNIEQKKKEWNEITDFKWNDMKNISDASSNYNGKQINPKTSALKQAIEARGKKPE